MTVTTDELGEVRRTGETLEIVFRRRYGRPVEKIWAALTVPERISDWFGETTIDGDRIRIHFPEPHYTVDGRIIVNEPMRAFAWTWPNRDAPDSIVRFDLQPDGDGCILTLTNSGVPANEGPGQTAGWHAHLAGMEDAADGRSTSWATVLDRERSISAIYKARAPA